MGQPYRTIKHLSDDYVASLKKRLKQKTAVTDDGCHLFTGALDANGYGKIASKDASGSYTQLRTHVASYLLYRGDIPADYDVCHSCNVKPCFNPEHLYLGTRTENIEHAYRDNLHNRRISDEQVLQILRLWAQGEGNRPTQRSIAKRFGIDQQMVSRIVRRLSFRWVVDPKEN